MPIESFGADAPRHIKALGYGPSGIGKTTLITGLIEHDYKPLVLDINKGLEALGPHFAKGNRVDRIVIEPRMGEAVDSTGMTVHRELTAWEILVLEVKEHVLGPVRRKDFMYDVLVVDDLTELAKYAIDHVMKQSKGEYPGPSEYGRASEHLRQFVQTLRDLPIHVYMIALPKEDIDNDGNRKVFPALQGKLSSEVAGYFNLVFWMDVRQVQDPDEPDVRREERFLLTTIRTLPAVGVVQAKDRSTILESVELPDLGAVFDKLLHIQPKPEAQSKATGTRKAIRQATASQSKEHGSDPSNPQV